MLPGLKATHFSKPESYLGGADLRTIGTIIATASDISLVVDRDDLVQDFALGVDGIDGSVFADWLGEPIEAIVTLESRQKIRDIIETARRGETPRWREVNHPVGPDEPDLPVRYCGVMADDQGSVMLLGRDLRTVAALQRRLVSVQQSLERDYGRLLQMETRYRLLFQTATEAFMILDAGTGRVLEANGAAAELFARPADEIARRRFPFGFDDAGMQAIGERLQSVRNTGKAEALSATLSGNGRSVDLFLSLFRAEGSRQFLVRMTAPGHEGLTAHEGAAQIVSLFRTACEGIVMTDAEGRIEWANDAFLDLAQVAVETQLRDENIDRFFARRGIDLPLILSNTREGGRLRFYSTSLSGAHGLVTEVEVSSVALGDGAEAGYGFVFRNAAFRPSETPMVGNALPRSAEQLTELIGRVPLKDLVRETVDVIERLCIEAALRMTDDNRASAADLLGLSRQSLYVKLRRYGLGSPDGDERS